MYICIFKIHVIMYPTLVYPTPLQISIPPTTTTATTTATTTDTTTATTTDTTTDTTTNATQVNVQGCGKTSGCMQYPIGCKGDTCKMAARWTPQGKGLVRYYVMPRASRSRLLYNSKAMSLTIFCCELLTHSYINCTSYALYYVGKTNL